MGEWITDEEGVKDYIRSGFINLFTTELSYSTRTSDVEHFSCNVLSEWEKNKLSEEVTMAKVKAGMWALKPFKALGADRIHDSFFQRFWHEVQEAVSSEVVLAFQSGTIPDYLNAKIRKHWGTLD